MYYLLNLGISVDVDVLLPGVAGLIGVLPVKFRDVSGNFTCSQNKLISLVYGPTSVFGNFDSRDNQLVSLEGSATNFGVYFTCGDNILTSLLVGPESVGSFFVIITK